LWLTAAVAAGIRVALSRWTPFDLPARVRQVTGWIRGIPRFWRAQRRNTALFYFLVTLVAIAILPGPEIGLWPHVYWIPPLSFIRAPLRFSLLAVLGLSVLAGYAFDRYASWLAPIGARGFSRASTKKAWALTIVISAL